MIPLLREEEQPPICRQYNCFKIEDIKNIMIAKSKKKKNRRIAINCSLSGPFYQLVGILHLNSMSRMKFMILTEISYDRDKNARKTRY